MTIVTITVIVIAIIIAVPLIIALFVKREYTVERNLVINKPTPVVFNYVSHIKKQVEFNVWVQADPNMKQEFTGTDGTVGFINSWNGNKKVGEGEQEITKITPNDRMDMALRFKRPMESNATAYFITKDAGNNRTALTWGMNGRSPYPMNFMNLFMNAMLGRDMETSLNNLKDILEKSN